MNAPRMDSGTDGPIIHDVRVWPLRAPLASPIRTSFGAMVNRPAVLVQLIAENGVTGWGEAWVNFPSWALSAQRGILRTLLPEVIGCAVSSAITERLYRQFRIQAMQWGGIGPFLQALSAIDVAIWDLLGHQRGQSVAALLRDSNAAEGEPAVGWGVPVYASGIGPERLAERIASARAEGHTAFKIKVGFGAVCDHANVRAAREALLNGHRLMVDANQAWTRDEASAQCAWYQKEEVDWVEEPLLAWDLEGYQELTALTPLVAAGENWYVEQQIPLSTLPLKVFQPDGSKCGGIWGYRRWVSAVRSAHQRVALHVLGGALAHAAALAVARAERDDVQLVEMDTNEDPFRTAYVTPWRVKEGRAVAGDIGRGDPPGLGVQVDEDRLERWIVDA